MPSFYKERGTWVCSFTVQQPDGSAKRQKKRGFDRERDAKRWYDSIAGSLIDGAYASTEKMTVGQWLTRWHEVYCAALAPATREGYRVSIDKHLVPNLGKIKLTQLRPDTVQAVFNKLSETKRQLKCDETPRSYSAGHLRQIFACLSTAMNRAVFDGLIPRNPCKRVRIPEAQKPTRAYCTAEQLRAVLKSAKDTNYYMPVMLCMMLGLRRGEALGVKWSAIDFDAKKISITSQVVCSKDGACESKLKTGASARTLDIPDALSEALRQHRRNQLLIKLRCGDLYIDEDFVCAGRLGGVLHPDNVSRGVSTIMAGIAPDQTLHDLRHSYATLLRQSGVAIEVISSLLGHADVSTTYSFYVGEDEAAKKSAAQRIDSIINQ